MNGEVMLIPIDVRAERRGRKRLHSIVVDGFETECKGGTAFELRAAVMNYAGEVRDALLEGSEGYPVVTEYMIEGENLNERGSLYVAPFLKEC